MDHQLFTDGSTMEGTTHGGAGHITMARGAIIHRWHAPTGAQNSSFQAEKTALQAAIALLEGTEDWHKALLIFDGSTVRGASKSCGSQAIAGFKAMN